LNIALKCLVTGLVAVTIALPAWAGGDGSDGHTHAAQLPVVAAPISMASPRITTETDQFELVGVLEGKVLTLYLDQFGTNTPVTKAQIEVESGVWKAKLRIPDIYENAENQHAFAKLLNACDCCNTAQAVIQAIQKIDALKIKGLGPAVTNLLYFIHPTLVCPFNTAIVNGVNAVTGSNFKLGR